MPSSGGIDALQDPHVPLNSLHAAGPSCGAGVGVVALKKKKLVEAADRYLPGPVQVQKESVDPWFSAFWS